MSKWFKLNVIHLSLCTKLKKQKKKTNKYFRLSQLFFHVIKLIKRKNKKKLKCMQCENALHITKRLLNYLGQNCIQNFFFFLIFLLQLFNLNNKNYQNICVHFFLNYFLQLFKLKFVCYCFIKFSQEFFNFIWWP